MDAGFLALCIPVVTALVEAMRQIPALKDRTWALPWLSILTGIAVAAVTTTLWTGVPAWPTWAGWTAVHGLIAGLSASGFYSAVAKPVIAALTGGEK